jgi:hypothetical protein
MITFDTIIKGLSDYSYKEAPSEQTKDFIEYCFLFFFCVDEIFNNGWKEPVKQRFWYYLLGIYNNIDKGIDIKVLQLLHTGLQQIIEHPFRDTYFSQETIQFFQNIIQWINNPLSTKQFSFPSIEPQKSEPSAQPQTAEPSVEPQESEPSAQLQTAESSNNVQPRITKKISSNTTIIGLVYMISLGISFSQIL